MEARYERLRWNIKRALGALEPLRIMPYRGMGNQESIYLSGRVLEAREVGSPKEEAPWWKNLRAMFNRFNTDEAPGAKVQAEFQGQSREALTDAEGYFQFEFPVREPLPAERLWHAVALKLLEAPTPSREVAAADGLVLVPSPKSRFGVISDIDDTVMKSSATSWWRMARLTFLKNARTRKPFEGVAAFYRALHAGADGAHANPIFYVSSSPWNLYDLIEDFLDLNGIPLGPILLRDLELSRKQFSNTKHEHKLDKIKMILSVIPETPFVLIGDSGQQDPILYREAIRRFPGRIQAIYIRDVSAQQRAAVEQLIREAAADGVEMVLAADSYVAAQHAADRGLIRPEALEAILSEREKDRFAPEAERPTV